MQIDINSIARATNAAHYEYLTTVRKDSIRTDSSPTHLSEKPKKRRFLWW